MFKERRPQGPVFLFFNAMTKRPKQNVCSYCGAAAVRWTKVQGRPVNLCAACLDEFRRLRSIGLIDHRVLRAEAERRRVWGERRHG